MLRYAAQILITGGRGFIGKNLMVRMNEALDVNISQFERGDDPALLAELVREADAIIHLAGENRPKDVRAFEEVNTGLTHIICDAIRECYEAGGRYVPLVLASSQQVNLENPYGKSKRAAEDAVRALSEETGNPCIVFRLPGVFGKWSRPNYNSVVATFCHNIARRLDIKISDPDAALQLAYIDDVITAILTALESPKRGFQIATVSPQYSTTVGDLAAQLKTFDSCREGLQTERVGAGLTRALYATYLSFLPKARIAYDIPQHGDERGVFVEILKTPDSGQFSYFTSGPSIARGGHYHHTKSEKFLVVKGQALFRFRHLSTGETLEITTTADAPKIVESIPGWAHSVTNTGTEDLIVMLWANETFDHDRPDTVACKV